MKIHHLAGAIALLAGCTSAPTIHFAAAPAPIGARFIVPEQQEAAPEPADPLAAIHVELPEGDVATLESMRTVDEGRGVHVNGDHIAEALPFECQIPFAIGICAVAPVEVKP